MNIVIVTGDDFNAIYRDGELFKADRQIDKPFAGSVDTDDLLDALGMDWDELLELAAGSHKFVRPDEAWLNDNFDKMPKQLSDVKGAQ